MRAVSSGLAQLLKGERTIELSCGLKLTARKLVLGDLVDIEEAVISKRSNIRKSVTEIVEALKDIKTDPMQSEIKEYILAGASRAVEDIVRSLQIATLSESVQYETSRQGSAHILFLACHEATPEIQSMEDARMILAMTSGEDSGKLAELIDWSTSFSALKNSEGPEV